MSHYFERSRDMRQRYSAAAVRWDDQAFENPRSFFVVG
jgi:hypothetical protein